MQSSPPGERGTGLGGWGQEETAQEEEGRKGGGEEKEGAGQREMGGRAYVQMQQHRLNCCQLLILYVKLLIRM